MSKGSPAYAKFCRSYHTYCDEVHGDKSYTIVVTDARLWRMFEEFLCGVCVEAGMAGWAGAGGLKAIDKKVSANTGTAGLSPFVDALGVNGTHFLKLCAGKDEVEFKIPFDWYTCFSLIYGFRCVSQHGDPKPTMEKGILTENVREDMRAKLAEWLANDPGDSAKKWASSMIAVLNYVDDIGAGKITSDEYSTDVPEELSKALGLWFPRMLRCMAILIIGFNSRFPTQFTKVPRIERPLRSWLDKKVGYFTAKPYRAWLLILVAAFLCVLVKQLGLRSNIPKLLKHYCERMACDKQ